jgi:hypothetical protein
MCKPALMSFVCISVLYHTLHVVFIYFICFISCDWQCHWLSGAAILACFLLFLMYMYSSLYLLLKIFFLLRKVGFEFVYYVVNFFLAFCLHDDALWDP